MTLRAVAASFNAIAMVALAFTLTGGSFDQPRAVLAVWGSAAAAVTAALVILTHGPAVLGWAAIGWMLASAILGEPPYLLLILLAVAYMPIVQRPRGSLLTGLGLAVISAALFRLVMTRSF